MQVFQNAIADEVNLFGRDSILCDRGIGQFRVPWIAIVIDALVEDFLAKLRLPAGSRVGAASFIGAPRRREGRSCAVRPRSIRPARSSTPMCFETAWTLIENGAASSLTVASPSARRARIARRVGSARAAKVLLSWSTANVFTYLVDQLIG